ncbi:MAG: anthranilate phosphoribosyltransferase, partial [Chloroflexi bacterium]|nr:anthranilate phosphoribosyltransferase [Chloroflexota bacterium]
MIREAIAALVDEGRDLTEDEAAAVMDEIMNAEATPAQFGACMLA